MPGERFFKKPGKTALLPIVRMGESAAFHQIILVGNQGQTGSKMSVRKIGQKMSEIFFL